MEDQGAGEERLVDSIARGPFSSAVEFLLSFGFHLSERWNCAEDRGRTTRSVHPNSAHTCFALPTLYYVIRNLQVDGGKNPPIKIGSHLIRVNNSPGDRPGV